MSIKKVEYKSFQFKINNLSETGLLTGYASTFGNVDYGMDVVDKGAFKKSLKENGGKWPILADHNPTQLLGFNIKATEDDIGLAVEFQLNMEVALAREKYSLAKQAMEIGTDLGLSIGYMTIKAEPDRSQPGVRRLKELKLFEHSIVTFPMNVEAMITASKGLAVVDRAKFLIEQLKAQGIQENDLSLALQDGAAPESFDPRISQSLDRLIKQIKG